MKQILYFTLIVFLMVGLIVLGLTLQQVGSQELTLKNDLERRTELLADSFKESIRGYYLNNATSSIQAVLDKFAGRERLLGLAVFNSQNEIIALSVGLPQGLIVDPDLASESIKIDNSISDFSVFEKEKIFSLATPIRQEGVAVGSLVVLQKANYIDNAISQTWKSNILRLFLQSLFFSLAIFLIINLIIYRPVKRMAEIIRLARNGIIDYDIDIHRKISIFKPVASEIKKMARSLALARNSARDEARMRMEQIDSPWTADRLKEFFNAYLKGRQIFVVSNREPYVHFKNKGKIDFKIPASGMVTALEPVVSACGGTWLAYGSGDADRETVDKNDKVQVPPDEPKYVLKRIWLNQEEIDGYYNGFSNEAMWPLCLLAHNRPLFRKQDWLMYKEVNGKFAKALLKEIKNIQRPIIMIQDYHFALLPEMIKKSRPDAEIGLFWHIPWPSAEVFSICPWRKEILSGMLGADVLGFHAQQFCNNFLETAHKEIESISDREEFAIIREDHVTRVKNFPISVSFTGGEERLSASQAKLLDKLKINSEYIGIGVDRMDYTKGLLEKFKGLEFFFDMYPEYRKKFTFIQIAPLSREGVSKYRKFNEEVSVEAERINNRFKENGWSPIVLVKEHFPHEDIYPLYRVAHLCMVTSLSDGMNLVAKEYVAANDDESGVLILSKFTGAARSMKGALIINPYSAEETAEAIYQALSMPSSEQHRRMKKMRESVRNYNIYRWAAEFLKSIAGLS